jgi:hypothetical protein
VVKLLIDDGGPDRVGHQRRAARSETIPATARWIWRSTHHACSSAAGSLLVRGGVVYVRIAEDDDENRRDLAGATLAHGDFDTTVIFQVDGDYSGLIDFGEL